MRPLKGCYDFARGWWWFQQVQFSHVAHLNRSKRKVKVVFQLQQSVHISLNNSFKVGCIMKNRTHRVNGWLSGWLWVYVWLPCDRWSGFSTPDVSKLQGQWFSCGYMSRCPWKTQLSNNSLTFSELVSYLSWGVASSTLNCRSKSLKYLYLLIEGKWVEGLETPRTRWPVWTVVDLLSLLHLTEQKNAASSVHETSVQSEILQTSCRQQLLSSVWTCWPSQTSEVVHSFYLHRVRGHARNKLTSIFIQALNIVI